MTQESIDAETLLAIETIEEVFDLLSIEKRAKYLQHHRILTAIPLRARKLEIENVKLEVDFANSMRRVRKQQKSLDAMTKTIEDLVKTIESKATPKK